MSIQAMVWVMEHSRAELGARLVLLAIANHADARGENAYPSISKIAAEANLSTRQVRRAVKKLVELGELEVIAGGGINGTNRYRLSKFIGEAIAEDGDNMSGRGVTICQGGGDNMSPKPSFNRPKKENPLSVGKRKRKLPDDCPSEKDRLKAVEYWRRKGLADIDVDIEADAFRAHHEARGTTMLDWSAAWRTWYIHAAKYAAGRGAKPAEPKIHGISRSEWATAIRAWKLDRRWHPDYGPEPGQPGCRAPGDLVDAILGDGT